MLFRSAEFKNLVSEGKVHYFIAGGGFGGFGGGFGGFVGRLGVGLGTGGRAGTGLGTGPPGGAGGGPQESRDSQAITSWVESHYTAKVVGGVTLYDLTQPKG